MAKKSPLAPLVSRMQGYDSKAEPEIASAIATLEAVLRGEVERPDNAVALVQAVMKRMTPPRNGNEARALLPVIALMREHLLV